MMYRRKLNDISVWQFELFRRIGNIEHFVTERHEGVSKGKCQGLNLSYNVDDLPENVTHNRKILAENLNLEPDVFFYPNQCHTPNIKRIDADTFQTELVNTDALVTNIPGKVLCVTTADCIPLILLDASTNTIAVVHAGWRGLVAGIIPGMILRMKSEFGCEPENITACIGPSISAKHYEVGPEVWGKVKRITGEKRNIIETDTSERKALLNLWELARYQLVSEKITEENIEIPGICTFENVADFYSARKEGFHTGRFCSGIMLL